MKICTLGLIYGMKSKGLASWLCTTKQKADELQKKFIGLFPQVITGFDQISASGVIRAFSSTSTGLKRYRAKSGEASQWEKNWLSNHAVQGSAAAVFKTAGNRLDRLYQRYGAKLIIPLHDSFVFEAPLCFLGEVAEITEKTMCGTFQEFFPELKPRVNINISKPNSWNKNGKDNALELWIQETKSKFKK